MKKILTLCAGILLVFGLAACDENTDLPGPGEEPEPEVTEPEPETGGEGGDTGDGGETQYVELELVKDEYTLTEGDDPVKLEYNVNPLESDVNVTSSNVNTATVEKDEYGQWWITPVLAGYGDATLTVIASHEGYESDTRTATVTVQEAEIPSVVTGISIIGDTSYTVSVGQSVEFVYGVNVAIEGTGNHSTDFEISVDSQYEEYVTISNDKHTITATSYTSEAITIYVTATGSDVATNVQPATATLTITQEVIEPEVTEITFNAESYEVTYKQGETNTLDLSSAVTVTGSETLTDKAFTISCEEEGYEAYFTISNNVITAKAPTSTDGIEIKATSHFDSDKVATAKVVVTDGTTYVEKIEFSGIDNNEVTLYTGNTDESHPNTREVTAVVTPTEAYNTEYEITVADTSVAEWGSGVLQAKNAGTTTITATSKGLTSYDGTAATVTATVIVEYVTTPVSTISFSQSTYSTKESESFTIGGADSGATIRVVNITEGADDKTWSLSVTEGEEYITISDPANGIYTVSPKAGSANQTATIRVTPIDPASDDVYAELTVTILADDYDVIYVESLVLSQTEMTVTEGKEDSFTIGGTGSDVTVTVNPSDATNPAYTVSSSSDKVTVTGSGTSWTVNILSGASEDNAEGTTYEIVVASEDGHATSTLTLTVNRPESVPTDWEVTTIGDLKIENVPNAAAGEQPATLDLDTVVSITIKDQYGETMDDGDLGGYTVTADTNNITVENHIVSAASYESDTASVTLTSSDIANKTATLSITLVAKEYPVESITVDGGSSVTESVEWGGSTSVTVSVTPTYADNTGYSVVSNLESSNQLFEVAPDGSTVTFTHKGVHAGTEVFTITPDDGTNISCTVTLTAEPEIIEPGTPYFENLAGTYEHTATFNNLESYLNYNWAEEDTDHVHDSVTTEFTSSNTGVITIEESTATIVGTGETTIKATINADHLDTELEASAKITIIWTATELKISDETLTLEEGNSTALSVSFGPEGYYTTTPTVTWTIESGGEDYVSLSSNTGDSITVTALENGAGSATITASAEGCASVSCTVTVTAAPKFESYTFTLTLYQSNGSTPFPEPTGNYGIYINTSYEQDQWNGWGTHEMEYDSETHTYSWTTTSLPSTYASEPYYATIYAGEDADTPSWTHALKENIQLTVTSSSTGAISDSESITMSCNSWEELFAHGTEDETFYVVMIDASGRSNNFSGNLTFYTSALDCWSSGCAGTQTKTQNNKWAVYSEAGTARSGDSDWFQVQHNNAHMSTDTVEIPSDSSGTPVYLAGGWFSDDWASSSDWWDAKGSNGDCYWTYMPDNTTISDFVASLSYGS